MSRLAAVAARSDQHDASVADQAVQQALAQQRQQQEDAAQKAKLRKLQRKLAHEKGQDAQKAASAAAGGSGGSGSQQGGGGAAGNGGGGPRLRLGMTANNAGTTCSFALNVAEQYRASGGASTIEVYSPVTKQTYTMSCVGASGHHLHRRQQRVGDIQLTRALVALAGCDVGRGGLRRPARAEARVDRGRPGQAHGRARPPRPPDRQARAAEVHDCPGRPLRGLARCPAPTCSTSWAA